MYILCVYVTATTINKILVWNNIVGSQQQPDLSSLVQLKRLILFTGTYTYFCNSQINNLSNKNKNKNNIQKNSLP